MAKIRIGNDIAVTWTLKDGEGNPYDLTGRNVEVHLRSFYVDEQMAFEVTGESNNVASFTFYGKDQHAPGKYNLLLIENKREVAQVVFDVKDVFELVKHSWETNDESAEGITTESVQIVSAVSEGIVGPRGLTGNGIASAVLNPDYTLTLNFTDGTSYTTPSIRGAQGEQGVQGPQGIQGVQGIQGEQGESIYDLAVKYHHFDGTEAEFEQQYQDILQAAVTAAANCAAASATAAQDHTRAESDHTRAEGDHSTAASDHTQAGNDHTTASADHTRAASDHAQAVSDHSTAASDHNTAVSDHITAAADHETAEDDHELYEADHAVMEGYDDRLTDVERAVVGYASVDYTIERGAIASANGNDSTSTTRLRTSGYVTGGTLRIIPGSGKAMIFAYNEAGYIKNIDWTTSPIDVSIVGATKYRVVFAKTNDATITVSDFSTLGMDILVKPGVTADHLSEDADVSGIRMLNHLHGINYCDSSEITVKSGAYISRTTGEYKASGSSGTAGVTGYIPVSGMALYCNYGYGATSASWAAYRKATDAELTDSSVTKFVVGKDVVVFSHSGGQTTAKQYTYTSGDIYVRFTLSSVTDVMVNEGAVPQSYVPYSIAATFNGDLFGKTIDIDNIKQTEFIYNSANLCNPAECFFSDHYYMDGTTGRIATSSTTPSLGITGMIPIDEDGLYFEQSLVRGDVVGYAYFDEHGNYLDGYCTQHLIPGGTSKFAKYINGAKWVVFTIAEGSTNLMINKGDIAHPYEAYAGTREVISKKILPDFTKDIAEKKTMLDGVDIVLPPEIVITQGDRLQIFYRDIIAAYNPYDFDVTCICGVGKPRPRCFEYTPNSSAVGNTYQLTVKIYDNKHRVVASASTSIKVISNATSPASQKNILLIGASTLYDGTIAKEVNRRFTNVTGDGTYYNPTGLGLSNIALVGRTTTSDASVNQESQSGWQWKDYATSGRKAYRFFISDISSYDIREGAVYSGNGTLKFTVTEINNTDGYISCTYDGSGTQPDSGTLTKYSGDGSDSIAYGSYNIDSRNPFWDDDNNALDFASYINDYCGGQLDILVSYLGINDIFQSRTPQETIEDYVIPFLRALHTQSSATKVILCNLHIPSPDGGMGNTYGATAKTYWTMCAKYFEYTRALNELIGKDEFASWVSIASTFEEFDAENLYPTNSTRTICNRSEATETIQSDGVHPTTNGKKALADSIYHKITQLI